MKVTIEDVSSVKKKLHIQVLPDAIAREMEKAAVDVAKKAKIPGFRPGKAPRAVVERHYGSEIQSKVMNRLISDSYLKAVQENKLSPVEMPNITNISPLEKDAPLNFTALVEVRPAITLGAYDGIEVKDAPVEVSDDEINQTLERLRDMYAHLEVVEGRELAKEHIAIIDFEGFLAGKAVENAKATDYTLDMGTGALVPGFEDQLLGMKTGESRDITVNFPTDYHGKELAGKEAQFTVRLKEVKKKALPEVNDEFAKDIGEHQSLVELKKRLRDDITVRKRNDQASAQREELLGKLVDAHTFDVPEIMLEQELQSMARQQVVRLAQQGVDVGSTFDFPAFKNKNRDLAVKRVKGMLLLDLIADKEFIGVNDHEMNAALAGMARSSGRKLDEVKKYYESKEGGLDGLRVSLIHEKTLSLLLSRAKKVYN